MAKIATQKTLMQDAQNLLNNSSTAEDTSPVELNKHAAEITGAFDKHIVSFVEAFQEWSELAHTMTDQKHGTVMIARTKYRINQVLQALWQGLYGNRTEEEMMKGAKMDLDSVRYCDYENMMFRNTSVSIQDLPAEGAQEQMDFDMANKVTRMVEGELRFDAFKALFNAFKELYELTCEDTWKYVPWEEKDKRKANTADIAMALLRRRVKLNSEEE